MNSIIKYAIISSLVLLSIHSPEVIAKNCNNLIIILDPKKEETIDKDSSIAMATTFLAALQGAIAPIVTTSNIVSNFCFWKTTYQTELNQIKQEFITTHDKRKAEDKALEAFSALDETKSKTHPAFFFSIHLSVTDLTDSDWDVYIHQQADLVLLIPKNYSNQYKSNLSLCGFQPNILTKISIASPTNLLKQLKMTTRETNPDIVGGIESLLIKKPTNNTEEKPWNIYMTGHGSSATKKKNIKQQELKEDKDLAFWQESVDIWQAKKDTEQKEKAQAGWTSSWMNTIGSWLGAQSNNKTEENLQRAHKEIKEATERKNKLSSLLDSLKDYSDEDLIPQTASIASLNFNDFSRLMTIFNNHIKTSFLYYETCFGGGYNRILVNETLEKLSASFIVVAAGVNESSTIAFDLQFPEQRFIHFFNYLDNFFGQSTTKTDMPTKLKEDPLATIVKTVISPEDLEKNQPFVRIPSVGIFNALAVDKKVKILTNSIVKAHELEGKLLSITDPKTEIVITYPQHIAIPVHLKAEVSVISPTQDLTAKNNHAIHIFENIISNEYLTALIGNFIVLNSSYSPISFVIKHLACLNLYNALYMIDNKNPADVTNVIIHLKSDRSSKGVLKTSIIILFNFNEKTYSYTLKFADLAHNSSGFWEAAEDFSVTALDENELRSMAQKILNPTDLAAISTPISLSAIIEQLEKQIDTTTVVQKPGALKKVMLSQRLNAIENAFLLTTAATQKKWLEEQRKPTLTMEITLKRNYDNLNKLKQEIEQLRAPHDITEQEKTELLDKIILLQEKIGSDKIGNVTATRQTGSE